MTNCNCSTILTIECRQAIRNEKLQTLKMLLVKWSNYVSHAEDAL
jgi:hypothetical protein